MPKIGALVIANPDEKTFKFILVKELINVDVATKKLEAINPLFPAIYFADGSYPKCHFPDFVTVSQKDGIDLNDDALLNKMEQMAGFMNTDKNYANFKKSMSSLGDASGVFDLMIEDLYGMSDFLARFFILLGSPSFANNLADIHKEQKEFEEQCQKNMRRMKDKKKAIIKVSPITIDITEPVRKALNSNIVKKIRALLGWTDVRRSKEIISKYGIRFFRKDHERRIAADVDRRGAGVRRDVKSSQHRQSNLPEVL